MLDFPDTELWPSPVFPTRLRRVSAVVPLFPRFPHSLSPFSWRPSLYTITLFLNPPPWSLLLSRFSCIFGQHSYTFPLPRVLSPKSFPVGFPFVLNHPLAPPSGRASFPSPPSTPSPSLIFFCRAFLFHRSFLALSFAVWLFFVFLTRRVSFSRPLPLPGTTQW